MANILVIEDNPNEARILDDLITAAGYNVQVTMTGTSALELLREKPHDVVVMSLNLWELGGLDCIRDVRSDHPTTPIMVVTEKGSEEIAVDALRAGASNYLPMRNVERGLISMLDELLSVSISQAKRAIFLKRMTSAKYEFSVENDTDLVSNVVSQVELLMIQMGLFDEADRMRVGVAVHEATLNAMVHGNLGVGSDLKQNNWDEYYAEIAKRSLAEPYCDRRVKITVEAIRATQLTIVIEDEGDGFDTSKLPDPTIDPEIEKDSGRGLLIIRTFFDKVWHNQKGNQITMVKRHSTEPTL